jgi:hypothetical protein
VELLKRLFLLDFIFSAFFSAMALWASSHFRVEGRPRRYDLPVLSVKRLESEKERKRASEMRKRVKKRECYSLWKMVMVDIMYLSTVEESLWKVVMVALLRS